MASRFTFGRITLAALVAGLATGGATASYTLSKARLERDASASEASYARFSGNPDATGGARLGASRCPGCRDSYDMVYLDSPNRTRANVRVGRGEALGGAPGAREYVESLDLPPPETGWGDRQPIVEPTRAAPTPEDIARARDDAARDARLAANARQIARTVVQTETMIAPVTIHRPQPSERRAPLPPVRPDTREQD